MGSSLRFTLALFLVLLGADAKLRWGETGNMAALCNDFTRAGFFHRPPISLISQKWVIFLESGSFFYSSETCNRRYLQAHVRDRYSTDVRGENIIKYFDTALAWAETRAAGEPFTHSRS